MIWKWVVETDKKYEVEEIQVMSTLELNFSRAVYYIFFRSSN